MAFFDQIGKKLTDMGQSVSQSTKNFSDVTRLNSAINEKKKRVAQLYSSLGEAYYSQHKDDSAAEGAQLIGELNSLFSEIAQCEEEIKQIKGVTRCPSCGAEVQLNSVFCNACGAKIPQSEPVQPQAAAGTRFCPGCGAEVPSGNRFCNRCGAKLETEAVTPAAE